MREINEFKRFYSKVKLPNENGCMEWCGLTMLHGYGIMTVKGKNYSAHRYSFELYIGKIPPKLFVLHKCDNRKCVAPNHLFLGTQKDNMIDMSEKDRAYMKKGQYHPRAKLNNLQIDEIKKMLLNGISQKIVAENFNINQATVSGIVTGKSYNRISDVEKELLKSMDIKRRKENCKNKRRLSFDNVIEIKKLLSNGLTCTEISKKFDVHRTVINNIKLNKYYQEVL